MQAASALRVGAAELRAVILKARNVRYNIMASLINFIGLTLTLDYRVVGCLHWGNYTTW